MSKEAIEYACQLLRSALGSANPNIRWSIILEEENGRQPQGPGRKIEIMPDGIIVRDKRDKP